MTRAEQLDTIAEIAAAMRLAQRRYYRERERLVLIEAKQLEAKLDAALAELGAMAPEAGGRYDTAPMD